MRWFRMYAEMLDDEKVQMLSPELFKTWVNLLCIAATREGVLLPVDKLAFKLRVSPNEMQSRVEELILCGLLDIRPDQKIEPHNWAQRQWKSDDSGERVKKFRSKNSETGCNGYKAVTETDSKRPQSPDPDTDSETDNKLQLSNPAAARGDLELGLILDLKVRKGVETLLRQAEGFGLDVDELKDLTARNGKNPENYLAKLCLNRLQDKLPGLNKQIIRDALNGKSAQSQQVTQLLMGVVP